MPCGSSRSSSRPSSWACSSRCSPGASALALAKPDAPAVTTPVTWECARRHRARHRPPQLRLRPGPRASLDDGIIVSNYTEGPLTFRVYAADGFITEAGELDLLPAGEESQALGSWVAFEAAEVTIGGGDTATVPFTLTVPADATPGDYAAASCPRCSSRTPRA
ncbi:hypothetical protein NKG05_12045 [Oerskovia sp. M15]